MKKYLVLIVAAAGLAGAMWSSAAQESGFRIVVNPSIRVTTISKDDASSLLLKKKTHWEDGQTVEPVDLDGNSSTREAFSQAIHGRSVSSIKNYWQRQIFSGREVPPPELSNDADVIAFVRSRPGAIGYVSVNARIDGVKELSLVN